MSLSVEVACLKCKVRLQIGQSSMGACDVESPSRFKMGWDSYIYTGDRKIMKDLKSFINDHVMRCHKVIMCSDGDGDPYQDKLDEMKDYEPPKKRKKS